MYSKVYNSITEIDENQWNEIVGRNKILCSYKFLLAVEKSNINDCKYFYPVIYENYKIIAHTCVYSITTDLDTLVSGILKKIINFIRKFWKKFLKLRFLECGTPIAIGNTISFAEDINKQLALSHIIIEIENIAKKEKIGVIVLRDFYDNETYFFDSLICRKYKRVNNLPNTILEVKWNSFDEYLQNFRSDHRRKIIKKIKIAQEKGLTIEIYDEFSNLAEQLQILWYNVYKNAKEYKREILTKEFFINLNNYLNDKSKVIVIKKNQNIIGFALILINADTLISMYCGLDYSYNRDYALYFFILYNIIKLAIDIKKKYIDIGISTYLPKTSTGAKMEYLYMYMKHTNKLLSLIITNLFDIMNPKKKIITRNIFKEKIENKFAKNDSMIHALIKANIE